MAIESFRIQNFMGFENSGWIELRPVTLIFGRNSSGKSALIRSLLMLKQSLKSSREQGALLLCDSEGVDLGSFHDIVYRHQIDRPLSIGFKCRVVPEHLHFLKTKEEIQAAFYHDPPLPLVSSKESIVTITLSFQLEPDSFRIVLTKMVLESAWSRIINENRMVILDADLMSFERHGFHAENWMLVTDFLEEYHDESMASVWKEAGITTEKGFLPKLEIDPLAYEQVKDLIKDKDSQYSRAENLLSECTQQIAQFLEKIIYLGPIRSEPQRTYFLTSRTSKSRDRYGENLLLNILDPEIGRNVQNRINKWLKILDLGSDLTVKIIGSEYNAFLFKIMLSDNSSLQTNIMDVGYGTSQVLPVIIQSILAPEGSLVVIEQPELHLHPRAQAQLADVFLDSIYSMSNPTDQGNEANLTGVRFLLETHSEHLLLRLRRRLAETTSRKGHPLDDEPNLLLSDFRAFFVNVKEKAGSHIEPIELSEYGEIISYPDDFNGFFSEDLNETAKLTSIRILARRFLER